MQCGLSDHVWVALLAHQELEVWTGFGKKPKSAQAFVQTESPFFYNYRSSCLLVCLVMRMAVLSLFCSKL